MKREGKKLEFTTLLLVGNEGKPCLQLKKTMLLREDFAEREIALKWRHYSALAAFLRVRSVFMLVKLCLCTLEVKLDAKATRA